jgi:CHAD domain-containing protein
MAFSIERFETVGSNDGPEVEGNSFRQDLMIKMEQNFNQIAENRNRFLSEPDDVESAHQLRVSIRSFRSLISLGKKYLKPEKYQDYQDQFRQSAAEISTLREIDVIINTWNEHLLDQKLDPSQSVLIQELNRKRNIEKDRVIKIVSKNKYIDRLTKSSNDLIKTIRKSSEKDVPTQKVIDARLDKWYQYILKRMINYNEFNFSYIHPIRLKCKKYRYVSENFYGILDPEHRKRHQDVKKLQTLLGNTCDAIRNQEAILKIIGLSSPALEQEVIAFINYEKEIESNYRKLFDSREWLQQISEKEN